MRRLLMVTVVLLGASFFMYYFYSHDKAPKVYIDRIVASKELQQQLSTGGVAAGFAYLRNLISADSLRGSDCHPLVHAIGNFAFEAYGSFAQAMQHADEICNSGYVHGLIERGFQESATFIADAKAVCSSITGGLQAWECFHGLGHGFMYETSNDLPKSISLCETLSETGSGACINGVFMENFNSEEVYHPSKYRDQEHPFTVCAEVDEKYKTDCYTYAPSYYLALHREDSIGAFAECDTVEQNYRRACWAGIGSEIMKRSMPDMHRVEKICSQVGGDKRAACFYGAMSYYSFHEQASISQACNLFSSKVKKWCQALNAYDR